MLETIVVALDSSDASGKIIKALKALQIKPETKIVLCHVLSNPNDTDGIAVEKPHKSQECIYQEIEQLLHSYQLNFVGQSQIEIVTGDPAEEIIRLANIYRADSIVIGTRGLKGFSRIIQGSVSSQVVAEAPCSVFVVKPERF